MKVAQKTARQRNGHDTVEDLEEEEEQTREATFEEKVEQRIKHDNMSRCKYISKSFSNVLYTIMR